MSGLARFRIVQPMVSRLIQRRSVGTSNAKKNEPIITAATPVNTVGTGSAECKEPRKNWVSYGWSETSEEQDRHFMHMSFFVSISVLFTLGGWILCYMPDMSMNDWYQREGYLELRRREQLGLPRIDINLVDPAKVKLPSEEELLADNVEVII